MNLASMQDLPNILQNADSKHLLRIVEHPTLSMLHGDMWNEVLHNPTPSWVNACTCQRWPSESWSEVELLLFCLWDGEDRPHLSARCRGFSTLFFKSTERYGQNSMCLIVLHLSMFVRPASWASMMAWEQAFGDRPVKVWRLWESSSFEGIFVAYWILMNFTFFNLQIFYASSRYGLLGISAGHSNLPVALLGTPWGSRSSGTPWQSIAR